MNRGMDVTAGNLRVPHQWVTASFMVHNLSTIMAGASPTNLPVEIQSEAANTVSYAFSLPNDDYLIALWIDNVAVDHDAGTPSELVIPGFAGWNATGIDVLNGFEQELLTETENGELVIRDLLIRDYPLILRLIP